MCVALRRLCRVSFSHAPSSSATRHLPAPLTHLPLPTIHPPTSYSPHSSNAAYFRATLAAAHAESIVAVVVFVVVAGFVIISNLHTKCRPEGGSGTVRQLSPFRALQNVTNSSLEWATRGHIAPSRILHGEREKESIKGILDILCSLPKILSSVSAP